MRCRTLRVNLVPLTLCHQVIGKDLKAKYAMNVDLDTATCTASGSDNVTKFTLHTEPAIFGLCELKTWLLGTG